jgi:hypothetical protein
MATGWSQESHRSFMSVHVDPQTKTDNFKTAAGGATDQTITERP